MHSFTNLFFIISLLILQTRICIILAIEDKLEHIDPTLPPALPGQTPKCSVLILQQDFANTIGAPPAMANYTEPADCPYPWTRVVLDLSVSASDVQKSRIAAIWLSGVEILRTTTPLPMSPGTFWRVQKDITRYTNLLRQLPGGAAGTAAAGDGVKFYMMLENSNERLPGVYMANVTLHFYRGELVDGRRGYTARPTVKGLYRQPADIILPVSQSCAGNGFWFRIQNETHIPFSSLTIPRNTYRAVLEIFASHHEHDEFWYANPLRPSYSSGEFSNSNGGFRQLYATIDGKFVGGHVPFPVIYPGAINPYFWSPVAAIGSFDIPTYDLDVTPFLAMMIDGQPHEIGVGVRDALPHWLVTANLHLWVDVWSDSVVAGMGEYFAPEVRVNKNGEWRNVEGQSEVSADGLVRFTGWVASSKGNVTTRVRQKITFKSQVAVQNRGGVKQVEMTNKARGDVGLTMGHQILGRVQMFVEAPLQVQSTMETDPSGGVLERTRLFHQLEEVVNLNENQVVSSSTLIDRQDAEGSALMHDGMPVWGSGTTKSSYKYRDDANVCYLRTVSAEGGEVKFDISSPSCLAME
ncbi:peptide-N4-(N-acetyl-beta-glucosaminyl)asparagine amidase A-like [Dioscorea cayenensis subsp. rotundata]|uniref:Peptide-N4-(N-acetyl-beta- glucosaminyl)asparagine amidase A-like n=1 Tax=Dioscorea cayennensis subsp. rotundata TaxID=55577 RepID=A0AB40BWR3_DIOCR|nr:peptide-N4-(N-acetyl-beta-glucosaminyl)asparagine amidase A-like [Dioscorea cayenensis subsp. rotundata]